MSIQQALHPVHGDENTMLQIRLKGPKEMSFAIQTMQAAESNRRSRTTC